MPLMFFRSLSSATSTTPISLLYRCGFMIRNHLVMNLKIRTGPSGARIPEGACLTIKSHYIIYLKKVGYSGIKYFIHWYCKRHIIIYLGCLNKIILLINLSIIITIKNTFVQSILLPLSFLVYIQFYYYRQMLK